MEINKKFFSEIEPRLRELQIEKKRVIAAAIIVRIYDLIFFISVLSLFFGFLHVFPFSEFEMKTAAMIFRSIFYFIAAFVIFANSGNLIRKWYVLRNPEALKNKKGFMSKRLLLTVLIIVVTYFSGTYYLNEELLSKIFFLKTGIVIISLIIFAIPVAVLRKMEKKFAFKYKKIVIPEIIKNENASYFPDKMLSQEEFMSCSLFSVHQIYKFNGSDLIEGQFEGVNYKLSYLNVFDREIEKSDNKTEIKIQEIFNGMLFLSEFNKKFQGKTIIIPDISRELLGNVIGEMINELSGRMGKKLVKLEDPVFESNFSVYSTDQIEARYILTPSTIERINDLKNHFFDTFKISFSDNTLYIAVFSQRNLFDPDIFSPLNNQMFFEKYCRNLSYFLNIVRDLKLNLNLYDK